MQYVLALYPVLNPPFPMSYYHNNAYYFQKIITLHKKK